MGSIGFLEFLVGLMAGTFITVILLISIKRKKSLSAEMVVAPDVLELEIKRAKRLGYPLAILLFNTESRNLDQLRKWLNTLGKDLRLREYDLILQWSELEVILVLPGAGVGTMGEALRTRFDQLLVEAGWDNISYGISLFPTDGEEITKVIEHARTNSNLPQPTLATG